MQAMVVDPHQVENALGCHRSEWRVANSEWDRLFATHHSAFAPYGLIVMFVTSPGVRSGSARRANSQSSERVFLGSTISSTQNFSAERNGERSLLSRSSISSSFSCGSS